MYRKFFMMALVASASIPAAASADETWTGPYIGAFAGAASDQTTYEDFACWTSCTAPTVQTTKLRPGIVLGFDVQPADDLVIGIAGDIGLGAKTSLVPKNLAGVPANGTYSYEANVQWESTVRARVGVPTGQSLLYVTGGLAFAHARFSAKGQGISSYIPSHSPNFEASWQGTETGRSYGVGVEHKFGSVTGQLELLHTKYQPVTSCFANSDGPNAGKCWNDNLAVSPLMRNGYSNTSVKIGLSYRF